MKENCEHKGKYDSRRKFHQCSHPEKQPGLRLCVKKETCPLHKKD